MKILITNAICTTSETPGAGTGTPDTGTPITPGLPNTGLGSDGNNTFLNIVALVGLFIASILFVAVRKKQRV